MTIVQSALLVLGMGACARGIYALATQDVVEDNEHMTGGRAARFGAIMVVIGLGIVSHAIYQWPWVTSIVEWLRTR